MSVYIPVTSSNREDCEALHTLYTKREKLGKGAYGSVYKACKRGTEDCDYVLKIITFDNDLYMMSGEAINSLEQVFTEWVNEVEVFRKLNYAQDKFEMKISPIFYDSWYCIEGMNAYFYILMEKYDGDLASLIKKVDHSSVKNIMLRYMYMSLNFVHSTIRVCLNDIKLQNILYKQIGPDDYVLVFADFGKATLYSDDECIERDRQRFKRLIDYELSK